MRKTALLWRRNCAGCCPKWRGFRPDRPSPSVFPPSIVTCRKAAFPAAPCMRSYRKKAAPLPPSASSWHCLPAFPPLRQQACIRAGASAARIGRREKLFLIMPAYGLREYGRPHGHGCNGLGLDPGRLILAETRHRNETLWAMEEALRSGAPAAVAGVIDKLDLKLSQRLHLAAVEAGLPLFLLRQAQSWNRARRPRAGASVRPRPHATASAFSRARAGISGLNAAATDGRANG